MVRGQKRRSVSGKVIVSGLVVSLLVAGVWIGEGMFSEEYLDHVKVLAAEENHNRIRDFVAESFTQCANGSQYIVLKTNSSGGTGNMFCNTSANSFRNLFTSHFNYDGFKNPHKTSEQCCYNSNSTRPPLGRTYIGVTGNRILINTNVGTDSGGNDYLSASVTKE